jgi:hypothetical protein
MLIDELKAQMNIDLYEKEKEKMKVENLMKPGKFKKPGEEEMERDIVEYDYNRQNKMEEIWARWLRNKEHLHAETIAGIKDQWKSRECSLVLEKPYLLTRNWAYAHIELEVQVGFAFEKAEPPTQHSSGSPASLEIIELKLGELIFPQRIFNEVMKQVKNDVEEACWEEIETQKAEDAIAAAEHHLDFREDK